MYLNASDIWVFRVSVFCNKLELINVRMCECRLFKGLSFPFSLFLSAS